MAESMINSEKRLAGFRLLLDAMISGTGTKSPVEEWRELICSARPEDLVLAVDSAVAAETDFELLKPAVSKLINLLSVPLKRHRLVPLRGGPLFASLLAENECLHRLLESGKPVLRQFTDLCSRSASDAASGSDCISSVNAMRRLPQGLAVIDIHYKKMENVVFPWFENRFPQFRCVRLMWAIHDDVRTALRELASLFPADSQSTRPDPGHLNKLFGKLYFALNANALREECGLFPVMADLLSPAETEALFDETRDYDFAFQPEMLQDRFTNVHANQAAAFFCAGSAMQGKAKGSRSFCHR